MVQLLLDSGAVPRSFNDNGRIPLWYAASEGHTSVLALLLKREHDAYSLMEDRKVKLIQLRLLIQIYYLSLPYHTSSLKRNSLYII